MKKSLFKSLVLALALSFVIPQSASAALTVGSTSVTSDAGLTLSGAVGSAIAFGTTATTGTISIGGTAQTGTITIGSSTSGQTINILNTSGASNTVSILSPATLSNTNTLNLATPANNAGIMITSIATPIANNGTNNITIGGQSTEDASGQTRIRMGDGLSLNVPTVEIMGHLRFGQDSAFNLRISTSDFSGAGTTGLAVTSGSTDSTGTITTGSEAHTDVVLTFESAYALAPQCLVVPANAAAATIVGSGTSMYVTTTTTTMTITTASSSTNDRWSWFCVEPRANGGFTD